jgi:hypothetical protein
MESISSASRSQTGEQAFRARALAGAARRLDTGAGLPENPGSRRRHQAGMSMNTYSVEIRGQGFHFAGADGLPLRAFAVTRIVDAASETEAVATALQRVAREWSQGEFAGTGVVPQLEAGSVALLEGEQRLRARDSGYHFHSGGR